MLVVLTGNNNTWFLYRDRQVLYAFAVESEVDVLLASKNGEMFLEDLFDSIRAQTHGDWRILMADDGSTDETVRLAEKLAWKFELNFELVSQEPVRGAAKNFARLLQASDAPYFAFADQDDIWYPKKLEACVAQLETTVPETPGLVFHDAEVIDELGRCIETSHLALRGIPHVVPSIQRLLMQNPASGNTIVGNAALRTRALPMPPQAPMHDAWAIAVATMTGEVHHIAEPLIGYRRHVNNTYGPRGMINMLSHEQICQALAQGRLRVRDRFQLASAITSGFAPDDPETAADVEAARRLLEIRSMPLGRRQYELLRGGYFHHGFLRNAAMLVFV